jgi:prephenate dehydrogenase
MNVAIAGLGLIGGSFAKAIAGKTRHRVAGYDLSPEVQRRAFESGVIDSEGLDEFRSADIVLVALYPGASISFLREHIDLLKSGVIVIDLCGVKRCVVDAATELFAGRDITYIGGHPMAGRELSGFDASQSSLYDKASMILTPSDDTPADKLKTAENFFLALGFKEITKTTPEHHDEMIAFTSQLAHIVSSAYAQNPVVTQFRGFVAGSFGDMTRVAKLNEDMWTELFLLNSDFLTEQMDVLIKNLEAFRKFISGGDAEGLHKMLKTGREIKEGLNEGN